jgi:tRNA uridine 5-carboxymethylaminomethyl modification enzyme
LPFDVQFNLVRSMKGLENAHILRAGYAIEYDYFDPRSLKQNFETKQISGLFFAGQINGTTGYEEAAAQGLYAGIQAGLFVQENDAWYPQRHEAYLGVLIDDLITQGVTEPYRMFTSRAEYRLSLREDNADERLTPIARKLGLVSDEQWQLFEQKRELVEQEKQRLKETWVNPYMLDDIKSVEILGKVLSSESTCADLLKRPEINYAQLFDLKKKSGEEILEKKSIYLEKPLYGNLSCLGEQVAIELKYAGYIKKQQQEVEKATNHENMVIPDFINFSDITALSIEAIQKLKLHSPRTIGQASRISGITPATISLLMVAIKKGNKEHQENKMQAN